MAQSDLLSFGIYAIGAAVGSKKRKEEAALVAERKAQEEADKARAEQTMHTWVQEPGGVPKKFVAGMQVSPLAKVVARRVGTGKVEYIPEPVKQTNLYRWDEANVVGTKAQIEAAMAKSKNYPSWDSEFGAGKLTWLGYETFNPENGEKKFTELPASMRPQKPEKEGSRYVTVGVDANNQKVYAQDQQTFKKIYPGGTIQGDISLGKGFIEGFNASPAGKANPIQWEALSEKQTSYASRTEEKSRVVQAAKVRLPKTNRTVVLYGKDPTELETNIIKSGGEVLEIGSAKGTGPLSDFTLTEQYQWDKRKDTPTRLQQYVRAYPVDERGNKTGPSQEMLLTDFEEKNKKGTEWAAAGGSYVYQLNSQGQEVPTATTALAARGSGSAAKMKNAIDKAVNVKYIQVDQTGPYRDKPEYDLYVPKDFASSPENQKIKVTEWLLNLPRSRVDGSIDWKGLGYLDSRGVPTPRLQNLVSYSMDLLKQLSEPRDRTLNVPEGARRAFFDNAQFFDRRFPALNLIPHLRTQVRMKANVEQYKAEKDIMRMGEWTDAGEPGQTIVTVNQREVPANVHNPSVPADMPPVVGTVMQGIQLGTPEYKETLELATTMLAPSDTPEARRAVTNELSTLIDYKRNADGGLATDSSQALVASPIQPSLKFLKYLTSTKTPAGDPLFLTYMGMVRGNPDLNTSVVNDIKRNFKQATASDYDRAHRLISIATPEVEGTDFGLIKWQEQTNLSSERWGKQVEGWIAQTTAADTAGNFVDAALATYRRSDGSLIQIGTKLGQYYVAADGFLYVAQQGARHIPFLSALMDAGAKVAPSQVIASLNRSRGNFRSILETVPESELREMAEARGMTYDEFVKAEKEAAAENAATWERTVIANSGPSEEVSKLSMRNYYRFMIAYTVASAIQGGTGGRTISDQDVKNILDAMKMDTFWSRPENEMKILQAIKQNMLRVKKHYGHLAAGGKRQYAALVMQDFDLVPSTNSLLIASQIEQPNGPQANPPAAMQPITMILDNMLDDQKTAVLKRINNSQALTTGKSFGSLEEARTEVGDSTFYSFIKSYQKQQQK